MNAVAGYVTDIPYVRGFKPMLAPAWLDHVALLNGVRPPARDGGFTWCDLGCGQGVTAAILAATHPAGTFHGIDAMPDHIAHASGLSDAAGIANAVFHAADFAAATPLELPRFAYIVAHGVYTWVDEGVRAALRGFIDRHLAPGGLVYVSYNALPGWRNDLPFQHLVRALGAAVPGDSARRFAAAEATIHDLACAGVPAFADSYIVRELAAHPEDYQPGYLVHEFLHAGWRPIYVTELRAALATIGLRPVGSATLVENFDQWVLTARGRDSVAAVADPDTRELLRDFWIDQRFRCDVLTRDAEPLDPGEQRRRLRHCSFALVQPAPSVEFAMATPAGRVEFDNAAAHAIVAALAGGPRTLVDIAADVPAADLLANMLALCAAGAVRPVEPGHAAVGGLNQVLRRRLGGPDEIPVLALPCGTALEVGSDATAVLRGVADVGGNFVGWRDLLASHGV